MDERRLADFIDRQVGRCRRVAVGPSCDAGTDAGDLRCRTRRRGSFTVHMKVDGSPGLTPDAEFALMNSLADAGLPVAAPRWSEPTGDVLGQPFFIADRVDTTPSADDPTAPTAATCVQTLARVHGLKADAHLPSVDAQHAIATQIELWRNIGKSAGGSRVPLLDAAEMWLHNNAPLLQAHIAGSRPTRCPHNPDVRRQVAAMTGWEHAHVGSAAEDWSYLATGDGSAPNAQAWRSLIERETGTRVGADEWSYWEAFNLFKRACINRTASLSSRAAPTARPAKMIAGTAVFHALLRRLMNIVTVG